MVLAVALALGLLHHLGDFVALGVHGGQRLESLIGLLVEHMALSHVLAHDQVESVVSVAHQVLHQVVQLAVLLLKMREGQARRVLRLLALLQVLGCLRIIRALFLECNVRLVEVRQRALSHLLPIGDHSEFCRPRAHLLNCLLHGRDVVVVHLAYSLVHIHDATRLAVVVMTLPKNRPRRFFEALI